MREVSSHSGWQLTQKLTINDVNRTFRQKWVIYSTPTRLVMEVRVERLEKPKVEENTNKMHVCTHIHTLMHEALKHTHTPNRTQDNYTAI